MTRTYYDVRYLSREPFPASIIKDIFRDGEAKLPFVVADYTKPDHAEYNPYSTYHLENIAERNEIPEECPVLHLVIEGALAIGDRVLAVGDRLKTLRMFFYIEEEKLRAIGYEEPLADDLWFIIKEKDILGLPEEELALYMIANA